MVVVAAGLSAGLATFFAGFSVLGAAVAAAVAAVLTVIAPFLVGSAIGDRREQGDAGQVLRRPFLTISKADARRAPNKLLLPIYGAAPFRGRYVEMKRLREWCKADAKRAVGLVTGPGGIGKSRLAAELCQVMRKDHWHAGFLNDYATPADVDALVGERAPTLIVVDDASGCVDLLLKTILALARKPQARRWRVLVLARSSSDWWSSLVRTFAQGTGDEFIDQSALLGLDATDRTEMARRDGFWEAIDAFSKTLGYSTDHVRVPVLAPEWLSRPLFLQMVALSALTGPSGSGGDSSSLRITEGALVDAALVREREYWRGAPEECRVDDALAARVVAVATCCQAFNEDEAQSILQAVPDLEDRDQATRRQIARWLRDLYPGERNVWFKRLEPDLLGNANLAAVLEEVPSLASRLLAILDEEHSSYALQVISQCAVAYPAVEKHLADAITANLERCWPEAMTVALNTGEPMVRILTNAVVNRPLPSAIEGIRLRLPTHGLAGLARVIDEFAIDSSRANGEPRSAQAALLIDLGIALSDLGQHRQALGTNTEAVESCRSLAASDPEAFRPRLAVALNNMSTNLWVLGRCSEALDVIDEVVDIYRSAATSGATGPMRDLAGALLNRSGYLSRRGRRDEAAGAIGEAVGILRCLAESDPDLYRLDLAVSLSNLAKCLSDQGRHEDALVAATEAVGIERAQGPDGQYWRPLELAHSLTNLSRCLAELGRRDESLTAIAEAVEIQRQLAPPGPKGFAPELAGALNDMANRLSSLGRNSEALAAIKESLGILRPLSELEPAAFGPDLARSLSTMANRLANLGRFEEALVPSTEAVALYRSLTTAVGNGFDAEFASAMSNLSGILSELGRHGEALATNEEAVEILRSLAAAEPDAFMPQLAAALSNMSTVLFNLGRAREALVTGDESIAFYRPLAAIAPETYSPHLASSLANRAAFLGALRSESEALTAITEAVELFTLLSARWPTAYGDALSRAHWTLIALSRRAGGTKGPNDQSAARRGGRGLHSSH